MTGIERLNHAASQILKIQQDFRYKRAWLIFQQRMSGKKWVDISREWELSRSRGKQIFVKHMFMLDKRLTYEWTMLSLALSKRGIK